MSNLSDLRKSKVYDLFKIHTIYTYIPSFLYEHHTNTTFLKTTDKPILIITIICLARGYMKGARQKGGFYGWKEGILLSDKYVPRYCQKILEYHSQESGNFYKTENSSKKKIVYNCKK